MSGVPVDGSRLRNNIGPLIYIHNARLPTEKAHGFQALKTAEALGNLGIDIEMWTPRRFNYGKLIGRDPINYYGLRRPVPIRRLPTIDLLKLASEMPSALRRLADPFCARLQTVAFSLATVARINTLDTNAIYYMRDCNVGSLLSTFRPSLVSRMVVELHGLPVRDGSLKRYVRFLRQVAGVVALTSQIRDELIGYQVSPDKITVEHDAVDLGRFNKQLSKDDARHTLGLPADKTIAGYIGRFHTMGMEKGIGEIIRSAKLLLHEHDNLIFLFVGGPLDRVDSYRTIIKEEGLPVDKFVFFDHQPIEKVPAWLMACDILLTPLPDIPFYSRYVSPMKLFEYMAAKRPIVASNLPSLCEVVTDSKTALLSNPGDPGSIAEKIDYLLTNPSFGDKIAAQAFDLVKHHTWDSRGSRITDFIEFVSSRTNDSFTSDQ